MSNANSQEQILQQITSRAAVDGEFRARLITEPHAAVRESVGIELPSTFRIKFVEKDANYDAMVVLPEFVDESAELSEAELEAVAGGSWDFCVIASANVDIQAGT
jgi:hypothetical protein